MVYINTYGNEALDTLLLRIAYKPKFEKVDLSVIALDDIVIYDQEGKPFRTYKNVKLDSSAIMENGQPLRQTQNEWIDYLSCTSNDLISFPLLYGILEQLYELGHPALRQIYEEMIASPFVTSTKIDYATNRVVHNVGSSDYWIMPCALPLVRNILSDVSSVREWNEPLRALFMCKDVEKAMGTLNNIGGLPTFIEVACNKETRQIIPHQGVSLYVGGGLKYVNCYSFPDLRGHTRRVKMK